MKLCVNFDLFTTHEKIHSKSAFLATYVPGTSVLGSDTKEKGETLSSFKDLTA